MLQVQAIIVMEVREARRKEAEKRSEEKERRFEERKDGLKGRRKSEWGEGKKKCEGL